MNEWSFKLKVSSSYSASAIINNIIITFLILSIINLIKQISLKIIKSNTEHLLPVASFSLKTSSESKQNGTTTYPQWYFISNIAQIKCHNTKSTFSALSMWNFKSHQRARENLPVQNKRTFQFFASFVTFTASEKNGYGPAKLTLAKGNDFLIPMGSVISLFKREPHFHKED